MHVMSKKQTRNNNVRAAWLYLGLLALLLYAVLPQMSAFSKSLPLLGHTTLTWLLAALLISLVAHVSAGFKYRTLALKPLRLYPTVLVQLAGLIVNRLLPAGVGGLGISYAYLYKAKHTKWQAGVVVTMNNLLGFVGHVILVALLLLIKPRAADVRLPWRSAETALIMAAIVLGLLLLLIFRRRLHQPLQQIARGLKQYRQQPYKLVAGTLWSMVIAASYAGCLWASAQALHLPLGFGQALIVLTLGVAANSVTPTPGGLVGVEAALVVGLLAYGLNAADSLAVALLFRLITYWFALLLGGLAFVLARQQHYI